MKILNLSEIHEEPVSHNPEILKKVMVRSGHIPKLTNFTQSRIPSGVFAPAHSHSDMYEVFLVESGSGVFKIDGNTVEVSSGSCVRVDLNEMHEIQNTGQYDLVLTYFGVEV